MNRIDLYEQPGMKETFWGGLVEYTLGDRVIKHENDVFVLLDEVCVNENLTPLHGQWNALDVEAGSKLLLNALMYDLAFLNGERMAETKARALYKAILSKVDVATCRFYTNWYQDPWEAQQGVSWDPVTPNTFDMAIVLIDSRTLVLLHVISED